MTEEAGRLGENAREIIKLYPHVFHMAELGSWEGIRRHGLLSTEALADLFELDGASRRSLLSRHRSDAVALEDEELGTVLVRDQIPMSDKGLRRALEDSQLAPEDWYRILNRKVFFWVSRERVGRLLDARAYRDRPHEVLVVETEPLVREYHDRIVLSPMNSGATKPYPHPRGAETFRPVEEYPLSAWQEKRRYSSTEPVVELAVDYEVPNIVSFVARVEIWRRDELVDVTYKAED